MSKQSNHPVAPVALALHRAFWIGVIALAAVAVSVTAVQAAHLETEGWVSRSREVARMARESERMCVDRETAIRGYLLTGDRASLAPDVVARVALPRLLDSLARLTSDDARQRQHLATIRSAVAHWEHGFAEPALRTGTLASTSGTLAGKPQFDEIRAAFDTFLTTEERLYASHVERDHAIRLRGAFAILAELAILALILVRQRRVLVAQTQQLELKQTDLEEQAVELELQAAELEAQTEELSDANAALTQTEDRYHRLVESAPYGVLVHCADRIVYVNTAAVALLGASTAADLVGRGVLEFVHHDSRSEARRRIRANIEDGLTSPLAEIQMLQVDGSVVEAEVTGIPFTYDGEAAVQVVLRDVGERKRLEAHLRQAQKMEAIGQLAGGVAHDFNNLLTVISAYGGLLLLSLDEGSSMRADVEEMCRAAKRAAALTGQLLAFSRQQVLQSEVLDLNAVVREAELMLRRVMPEDIRFETTLAPGLGPVYADCGQLEQVLMNLVVNARAAMPDGGTLSISTGDVVLDGRERRLPEDVKPGPYVRLSVADTGVGMDAATQAQIFEPFFTTKPVGEGTGLGLSTVYGIVSQSGGHLWVESEIARGTTFSIYLPRATVERAERPRSGPHVALRAGRETVLLVEDEIAVRSAMRRMLESAGYRVVEARDGEEALRLMLEEGSLTATEIDLVLTDVVMPGLGGPALVSRLRETHPHLRVIFMSGYTDDVVLRQKIVEPGGLFLQKPFTPSSLTCKVREALARD